MGSAGASAYAPARAGSSLFRHAIPIASFRDPGHRQPNNAACTVTFTVR